MIQWSFPEFEYHHKDLGWFVGFIGLAAILSVIALWQKNLLFLIFTAIAVFVIIFWAKEKPKNLNFSLDKKGVWVEKSFYEYGTFLAFAIKPGGLQLKNKARLRLFLNIPFPEDRLDEIKEHLLAFLPEAEYNESTIDALSRILRF